MENNLKPFDMPPNLSNTQVKAMLIMMGFSKSTDTGLYINKNKCMVFVCNEDKAPACDLIFPPFSSSTYPLEGIPTQRYKLFIELGKYMEDTDEM